MNQQQYTTRIQLKGYGASQYQARIMTHNLTPIGREKRSYTYALADVIASIKNYLKSPRIQKKTRMTLEKILNALLQRLDNVITVPFIKGTNPDISKSAQKLFNKITDIDNYFAETKANIATLKGKYKS